MVFTYHYWEGNRDCLNRFNGPQHTETDHLEGCEHVDSLGGNMAEVHKVWLVFGWHQ